MRPDRSPLLPEHSAFDDESMSEPMWQPMQYRHRPSGEKLHQPQKAADDMAQSPVITYHRHASISAFVLSKPDLGDYVDDHPDEITFAVRDVGQDVHA